MKKILMILLVLIVIFSTKDVFAQQEYQLTLEKQEGIYFSRHGVNFNDDSHPYYLYKLGNILAYCIEPGKHISTYTYVDSSDYIDLPFSEELKEKLELIGYYGRDYPGHNNIRYSMATQALIWELTGVDTVTFWTKQDEKGEEIDVTKERNEIMALVNNHKVLPNIKTSYTGYLNKEIIIDDSNKVLDNYEIVNKDDDIYIKDNKLHIMPKVIGTKTITLKRTSYDEYKTIIFVGKGDNSSQKIGRLHFNKDVQTKLDVIVKGVSVILQKTDENNQAIQLANIKFKVKNVTTNSYICPNDNCIYETNSNGNFMISGLDYGEYEIEEVEEQIVNGYSWNKDKLHFRIDAKTAFKYNDEIGNYLDLTFKNNSVKASLEIYKVGEEIVFNNNEFNYQDVKMHNISFDLYTSDHQHLKTITTNHEGYVKVDNLEIGKYYLIEKTKLNEYLEQDKIEFELKQDNQYQTTINYKLDIKNILKKGQMEFNKIDSDTKEGIADTIIEIYDGDNKLLLTRKTDTAGQVIVDNLPIGKYYIIEKEANSLYMITNEKVYFEIKENGDVIKTQMMNEKKTVKVPKTNTNEDRIINSLFGISLLVGLGRFYYERKKTF